MMMDVRAIRSDEDYEWALKEVEQYFDKTAAPGTPEAARFDVLSALIEQYESRKYAIPDADPVDVLRFAMESLGRSQTDLARLLGSSSRASEIMNRKRRLNVDMIRAISEEWKIPAQALISEYELDRASA